MSPDNADLVPRSAHNFGRVGAKQLLGRVDGHVGKLDEPALVGDAVAVHGAGRPPNAACLLPREAAEAGRRERKGPVRDARPVVDAAEISLLRVFLPKYGKLLLDRFDLRVVVRLFIVSL